VSQVRTAVYATNEREVPFQADGYRAIMSAFNVSEVNGEE